jgi:TetR/AcrR family transcriptional regulator, copper-responsive repressor
MWHNVAIAERLVKRFISDRYEKDQRDNGSTGGAARNAFQGAGQTAWPPALVRPRRCARERDARVLGARLYTAFGDKERLFLEAIERYGKGPGGYAARALAEEPTARRAIERLMLEAAEELSNPCHPAGCMMVMATTNCSVAAEHVQNALAKRRLLGVGLMQQRIQRGIDECELPPETDAGALANFYATVYQGMSMQAKDGAPKASLLRSVEMAMRSWPNAPPSRRGTKKRAATAA